MSVRHSKFYLDKRNAKVMGVCSGLADYTGIDALWIRIATVIATILGSGLTIIVYFVIAWVADNKPRELYDMDPEEARFWQSVRARPSRTVRDVSSRFRDIDRRMSEIETMYTSSSSRLARQIDDLK